MGTGYAGPVLGAPAVQQAVPKLYHRYRPCSRLRCAGFVLCNGGQGRSIEARHSPNVRVYLADLECRAIVWPEAQ